MRTAASNVKSQAVFVQKLLWFIYREISIMEVVKELSYKICYGLSLVLFGLILIHIIVIVQNLLWFITCN